MQVQRYFLARWLCKNACLPALAFLLLQVVTELSCDYPDQVRLPRVGVVHMLTPLVLYHTPSPIVPKA